MYIWYKKLHLDSWKLSSTFWVQFGFQTAFGYLKRLCLSLRYIGIIHSRQPYITNMLTVKKTCCQCVIGSSGQRLPPQLFVHIGRLPIKRQAV